MMSETLVKTGSGNGLLPDGIKQSPETVLSYLQYIALLSCQDDICTGMRKISILKLRLKFAHFKSQPHLSGDNELTAIHRSASPVCWVWRTVVNTDDTVMGRKLLIPFAAIILHDFRSDCIARIASRALLPGQCWFGMIITHVPHSSRNICDNRLDFE